MSLRTRVGLLAGASALTLTGVSVAGSPTEAQDQEARIAELEAQVAQLTGDNWLTEERSEEIRGLVEDVLADADTRASLMQSGMSAGYDDGFVIGSPDGSFSLKLNGHLQTRFIINKQRGGDDVPPNSDDDWRSGFENTRTRLIFSGNVAGPEWGYYINGNFARDGGDFGLQDAWISYDWGNGFKLMMGRMKVPLNREWLVDSMDQLLVERSNIAYFYGGGRTEGIALDYASDQFHVTFGYTNGAGAPFGPTRGWDDYDTEFSFTGRAEILFAGNWDQFKDFTSPPGSELGFMLGGGFHYQSDEFGADSSSDGVDDKLAFYILTIDASLEGDGWNVFGQFNYSNFDDDAAIDISPYGFMVHGGIYLNEKWEAFVRYEWNDFDSDAIDDLSILAGGVNAYYSTNVKMTADLGYAFDAVPFSDNVTGWREDEAGTDGQFVLRTQLQLTF